MKMEIVNLNGKKFGYKTLYKMMNNKHYGFYVEGKGFIAFSSDRDTYGILVPYAPIGGKKVLQSVIDTGGFISFEGMEFINTI